MDIVYIIFLFVTGLLFGSFYNVVGLRIPKQVSIVAPRSHCTHCKRELQWFELIPVASYLFLGGKCRHCKVKITPMYMLVELATGILFASAYCIIGGSLELIIALLFISLLINITVSDIAYMLVPDRILLFFLPLFMIGRILNPLQPWWDSLLGAAVGFGLLLLIAIVSKGGMGGGDVKLFFLIGLIMGTIQTLLTLFLAAALGMIIGIIMLKIRKEGRKTPIPFVPFITIASVTVYFYGNDIVAWYLNLL